MIPLRLQLREYDQTYERVQKAFQFLKSDALNPAKFRLHKRDGRGVLLDQFRKELAEKLDDWDYKEGLLEALHGLYQLDKHFLIVQKQLDLQFGDLLRVIDARNQYVVELEKRVTPEESKLVRDRRKSVEKEQEKLNEELLQAKSTVAFIKKRVTAFFEQNKDPDKQTVIDTLESLKEVVDDALGLESADDKKGGGEQDDSDVAFLLDPEGGDE